MLILANLLALTLVASDEPKVSPSAVADQPEAQVTWHLALPEAIRIGLDNSEVVRVVSPGGTPKEGRTEVVIARLDADASSWDCKAAIMAHVRSIEQQYWALSMQQVARWSRETAVKLGEEILRRERSEREAGRSDDARVAEAAQQLENFKLNLVAATSDLITTEHQLRNILGLPSADCRRIVPGTAPTEARIEPEWETTLATMLAMQPDVARQRQPVGLAEFQAVLEGENPTLPADVREASRRRLEAQQASLRQAIHQATHRLARFFLETDANHKQFQAARSLRAAAQERLKVQRASYEEGRVTLERLLDAVAQYAKAIDQEAQFKSSYNASIAALEEAKGTLLTHKGIAVADGPAPRQSRVRATFDPVVPASFEATPHAAPAPAPPSPALPQQPLAGPSTYKLRAKLGGIKMWEIELEINQGPSR